MKPGLYLPAQKAARFFMGSGLPNKTLQPIWKLSDSAAPKGKLTKPEFCTALALIALVQRGKAATLASLAAARAAQETLLVPKFQTNNITVPKSALSERNAAAFKQLWAEASAGTQTAGLVSGKVAVTFFQTSGLPVATLRSIWTLCDTVPPKGKLSESEFFTALSLIALAQAGKQATLAVLASTPKTDMQIPSVGSRSKP